jgi:hypothetical protein
MVANRRRMAGLPQQPINADRKTRGWRMTRKIESIIEDYTNGNLTDAKKAAKRVSWKDLFTALREEYGKSEKESRAIADYLKGGGL